MLYREIVLQERLLTLQKQLLWTYPLDSPPLENATLYETVEAFEQAHPDYKKQPASEAPIAWAEGFVYRRPDGRYSVCEPVSWQDIVDAADRAIRHDPLPKPFIELAQRLGNAYTSQTLMELIEEPSEAELQTVLEYARRAQAEWLAGPCAVLLTEWFDPFHP